MHLYTQRVHTKAKTYLPAGLLITQQDKILGHSVEQFNFSQKAMHIVFEEGNLSRRTQADQPIL